MTNHQKAALYDQYVRESEQLQRINSKLKSDYPINVPQEIQTQIDANNSKIDSLVVKLQSLFNQD
jgi:hypothetical protein